MKLAIVIPYYKFAFFESTLISLENQTNKEFNVYIGDDASPENPTNLLKKYKDSIRIQYKRFDSNLGGISLTKQWERCLQLCNDEEWVQILGDDDVLASNVVAAFYENLRAIENEDCSVIRFATQVVNENSQHISGVYQHPKLESGTNFLIRKFKGGTRSSLSEYILKRKQIDKIQFKNFPLAWYSDLLAVVEFSEFKTIYTINEAVVDFRLSGLNITSKTDDLLLKNQAAFSFYDYLLESYGKKIPQELSQMIFDRLEKNLFDNKKQVKGWIKLLYHYIIFFQWKRFLLLSLKVKTSIR